MSAPVEPEIQRAARLLAEGRPSAAADRLAALVAEAPTYAAAHVLRATALEAAGRVDDALVSWGRAAALVPSSALVHRERARLLATHAAPEAASLPPPVPAEPPADPEPEAPDAPREEAPEPLAAPLDPEPAAPPAPAATPDFSGDFDDAPPLPPDEDVADGPLLDFGAPAPPVAEPPATPAPPAAPEPPPDPDPTPAPAPPAPPAYDDPTPATFDASDLVFAPPPPAPPADPEPPASAPEEAAPPAEPERPIEHAPPPAPTGPAAADWDDETGLAPVLAPEAAQPDGPVAGSPDPPPPTDEGEGWAVLDEAVVPSPPPTEFAEPDVVPPEGDLAPPPEAPPETPDATVEDVPARPPSVADELDSLIAQLEVAPRIKPDPAFSGPEVDPDAGSVDDLASETLAKIYAAQHQYVEAALMYEKLAAQKPDAADEMLERAAELRRKGG